MPKAYSHRSRADAVKNSEATYMHISSNNNSQMGEIQTPCNRAPVISGNTFKFYYRHSHPAARLHTKILGAYAATARRQSAPRISTLMQITAVDSQLVTQ